MPPVQFRPFCLVISMLKEVIPWVSWASWGHEQLYQFCHRFTSTCVGLSNGCATDITQHGPRGNLTHWGRDKMAAVSQTTLSNAFFFNGNARISIKISLKFVPKVPINNIPVLVQIMAWRRSGDKPLSEPIMVRLPTHICVVRPQWVKVFYASLRSCRIRH